MIEEIERKRTLPINNLDSAWLSAEPDYTEVRNDFQKYSFSEVFTLFNSSIRLGNIAKSQRKLLEYDLTSAGEALHLGYYDLALSIFFDVAAAVEVSQGVRGFRTNAMNTITQEIKKMEQSQKKGIMGNTKEE